MVLEVYFLGKGREIYIGFEIWVKLLLLDLVYNFFKLIDMCFEMNGVLIFGIKYSFINFKRVF